MSYPPPPYPVPQRGEGVNEELCMCSMFRKVKLKIRNYAEYIALFFEQVTLASWGGQ
jgi:hypothetical protein